MKFSLLSVVLAIFAVVPVTHAASFNCAKASTRVEKTICSDIQLSDLDGSLALFYKKALTNTIDANNLKVQQRTWLRKVRNKCQNSACLVRVYTERINELKTIAVSKMSIPEVGEHNIILGRCHMNSCWWWKVEKIETVRDKGGDRLIRVLAKVTDAEYSDSELNIHGYPTLPSRDSIWDNTGEVFIFCSKKLPTYISFDEVADTFIGTIPFNQHGVPSGATEGIANLYLYTCKNIEISSEAKYPRLELSINPGLVGTQMSIGKVTDIFHYSNNLNSR